MTCKEWNAKLPEWLFGPESSGLEREVAEGNAVGDERAREHMAACEACRREWDELRATMQVLDAWEAPEPNPYFLTRLSARLDEERAAAPAGWWERLKARMLFGSRLTLRPVAALTMTAVLVVGGGAYLGIANLVTPPPPPAQAAVVHDLQTLDNNAQLLDQLESLSSQND